MAGQLGLGRFWRATGGPGWPVLTPLPQMIMRLTLGKKIDDVRFH